MIYPTCPKVKEVTKSDKTFSSLGVERVCETDQIPEEFLYELQENIFSKNEKFEPQERETVNVFG